MAYQINLDIFEGPLDLLLFLIKKNNLNIYDIQISVITHQYLEYIELMKELNLDVAGEFLIMATTLMEIKSKSLLPKQMEELDNEIEVVKKQLVDRLLEYQKYKNVVASFFKPRIQIENNVYYKKLPIFSDEDYYMEATVFDLLSALNSLLKKVPKEVKEIVYEEIHIEEKMRIIMEMLKEKKYVLFEELILQEPNRTGIIVMFLALLELIKTRQVIARQKESFGEIRIYPVIYNENVCS